MLLCCVLIALAHSCVFYSLVYSPEKAFAFYKIISPAMEDPVMHPNQILKFVSTVIFRNKRE